MTSANSFPNVELMTFLNSDAARQAVRNDWEARPPSAKACRLGDLMIVKPDGALPTLDLVWIMGFNGGETTALKDAAGHTLSARKWFKLCNEAATAIGSRAWIIGERTHWGSPSVRDLVRRTGSSERFRALLKLHAAANLALLRAYRPRVVWLTGLSSFLAEAVEDYSLTPQGEPAPRDKRGRLWQEYVDADGVPWLATIHPTGARISISEFKRVCVKLGTLAPN